MPINQFNDYPWQRRDAAIGSDRYERELDRRVEYREMTDEELRINYTILGDYEAWRHYLEER